VGKRSDFERVPQDKYPTPRAAVLPLVPHLAQHTSYVEPCAGDGALIAHLAFHGFRCAWSCDIEPEQRGITRMNALDITPAMIAKMTMKLNMRVIITNPPWDRPILHSLIRHFLTLCPAWLLFDADWSHTDYAREFLPNCEKIVSVGRVKWIEGSEFSGMDNVAWYKFRRTHKQGPRFYGKAE
jgi:hypothetical protein